MCRLTKEIVIEKRSQKERERGRGWVRQTNRRSRKVQQKVNKQKKSEGNRKLTKKRSAKRAIECEKEVEIEQDRKLGITIGRSDTQQKGKLPVTTYKSPQIDFISTNLMCQVKVVC